MKREELEVKIKNLEERFDVREKKEWTNNVVIIEVGLVGVE